MSYGLQDLITLMARLRDPKDGCPWDQQQTADTLIPHTLEEVYEVVDAIERQDWSHLAEELGDLLFQVVFYSEWARELGYFDLHQVIDQLTEKLIRRHPHVFPDGTLSSRRVGDAPELPELADRWNQIKAVEKPSTTATLADVPLALPAMTRALKLQKRAARVGFDWPEVAPVWHKLDEELAELKAAVEQGDAAGMTEELGDVLFSIINLARHLKIDSEQALRQTNAKFVARFGFVEAQLGTVQPNDVDLATLERLWQQAKQQDKKKA